MITRHQTFQDSPCYVRSPPFAPNSTSDSRSSDAGQSLHVVNDLRILSTSINSPVMKGDACTDHSSGLDGPSVWSVSVVPLRS